MVARTPPKLQLKKMVVPPLNPILLRETLDKVDRCMARLQELQYTVAGGNKVISGVTLSPRSTRGYLRTSLRCKQESFRIKNATCRKSSPGKMPTNTGEWRRMSLPAMLLGETVAEIKQASQFAREIVEAVGSKGNNKPALGNPMTPLSQRPTPEHSELRSRRKREKQVIMQTMRLESDTPSKQRAKSRINFKVSPLQCEKENSKYIANRVSPRNRPWVKKTVLFPNPLFHSSSPTSQFTKTNSPGIARNRQTPHKFLVKSPSKASASLSTKFSMKSPPKVSKLQRKIRSPQKLSESPTKFTAPNAAKFQVKIRSPPLCVSPTRAISLSKRSPKMSTAAKLRWSFSPSRLANRIASSPSKMRSFSPSRLVNRLASPLKSKRSVQKIEGMKKMMSGLKQRPQASTTSRQFVVRGI